MTNKIKAVFDKIHAEDKLKADTSLYIKDELNKRRKTNGRFFVNRLAAAVAAFTVVILTGAFSYNIYFTASAYVDLDVNQPIELALNRFDKIIGVYGYNGEDGEFILGLPLKHKSYDEAFKIIIDAAEEKGYLQDDSFVSATLQTDNSNNEQKLLINIQSGLESALHGHHYGMQIDVFPVTNDTRINARQQNISPAKYLAITELMSLDPTATFDSCKNHSISEIKELTSADRSGHHHNNNYDNPQNTTNTVNTTDTTKSDVPENGGQQLIENKGHHGKKGNMHGNKHN